MSDVVRADPDALRAAQPAVETLADRIEATLARLGSVLDAAGPCWGDDESGHAFGDAYEPAQRAVRAVLAQVAGRLHQLGAVLPRVADVAEAADERARERLS